MPKDDALLRRLYVIPFSYGERIDPREQGSLRETAKPQLKKLQALGHYIAKKVIDNPSLLYLDWRDLTEKLLEEVYNDTGLGRDG